MNRVDEMTENVPADQPLPTPMPRSVSRFWLPVAAVLAIASGAIGQGAWLAQGQEAPFVYEAGSLVAAGELESVLYDPSLSNGEDAPRAGDEFRNEDGLICRNFVDGRVSGMACRGGGDWRILEMRQD